MENWINDLMIDVTLYFIISTIKINKKRFTSKYIITVVHTDQYGYNNLIIVIIQLLVKVLYVYLHNL